MKGLFFMEYMTNDIIKASEYFTIFSDVNRLKVILCLLENEASVTKVATEASLSQPLASHHLKVLKDAGVVSSYQSGKFIIYKIRDQHIREFLNSAIQKANGIKYD